MPGKVVLKGVLVNRVPPEEHHQFKEEMTVREPDPAPLAPRSAATPHASRLCATLARLGVIRPRWKVCL